jgi:hypothetical protein
MKKTKLTLLVLLLLTGLALGIDGCNRTKTKQVGSTEKSESVNSTQSSTQDSSELSSQTNNTKVVNAGSVNKNSQEKTSLPKSSRDNPFLPIPIQNPQANKMPITQEIKEGKKGTLSNQNEKPVREITIRLIGIIGKNKAFIDEDGTSKVLSIGDTVAEMKVSEIRDDEVILSKGNTKYTLNTGGQLKTTIAVKN